MKNVVKKILCAVFSAILLLYGAACGKNGTENAGNGSDHGGSEVEEMILFEDGKSEYKIVYPDERTDAEEYAASVLRDYLFQISGVNLPVKQEKFVNYGENAKIISVGGTAYREQAGISALCDTIEGDGFLIKTSGENIFIDGGNDRGTLYGIYEFLDKYLGVKFLTYDYTYVPKLARFDFGKDRRSADPFFPIQKLYDCRVQRQQRVHEPYAFRERISYHLGQIRREYRMVHLIGGLAVS